MTIHTANSTLVVAEFERDGYYLAPPVLEPELLAAANARMRAVIVGEYETGIPPCSRNFAPGTGLDKLQKIDNAHRCDDVLLAAVSHPALGEWAAAVTGASMVQIFATQLLFKPPGGQGGVNVGWHQDMEYWQAHLWGEVFTAWLALSDVTPEAGPMRFVRGSNHWGLLNAGDFFDGDMAAIRERIQGKESAEWEEVAAVLPPGGVSFHHNLTVHGSGANLSSNPRCSFAIHLRTERSGLVEGVDYRTAGWLNDFEDERACPVIYRG